MYAPAGQPASQPASQPDGDRLRFQRLGRGIALFAVQIGSPLAVRAVGTAVGHNPIAVLVPCHRVIRKAGEFGNYRYGAARKKALLAKEYITTGGGQAASA